jgi:hypothetical protein
MKLGVFTRQEKTNKSFAECAVHMRAPLITAMMTLAPPGVESLMTMTIQSRAANFTGLATESVAIGIA